MKPSGRRVAAGEQRQSMGRLPDGRLRPISFRRRSAGPRMARSASTAGRTLTGRG